LEFLEYALVSNKIDLSLRVFQPFFGKIR
jgi:hypothetical protein